MTEAVKADAGTDKTQAEAQGAQSGEPTLAQLLDEGRKGLQANEPEKKQAETTTTATAAPVDKTAEEVEARVTARLRSKEQYETVVKGLTETAGINRDIAEALLERDLSKNAGMRQAWLRQFVDPEHWQKVSKAWQKERAAEFEGIKKKAAESVSDRAAIRAGSNLSPSAEAPPDRKLDIRNNPRDRAEWYRTHGIRHG